MPFFTSSKIYSLFAAFLLSATLSGCGDDSDNTSHPEQSDPIVITAQDASFSTGFSDAYTVELADRVLVSDHSSFIIADVEVLSENPDCGIQQVDETSFVISATNTKVCDYRYQVTSGEGHEVIESNTRSALSRVAVSASPNDTQLPPISATTILNTPLDINVTQLLTLSGADLTGYQLDTDLVLPYDSGAEVTVNSSTGHITYQPASDFKGVDRVLFFYTNNASEVLMGTLDIAVAYEVNKGIIIPSPISWPKEVNANTQTTMDISSYAWSEDTDDLQLIYVSALNAAVSINNSISLNHRTFTFQSSAVGDHAVTFAVEDHNGASAIGVLKVTVVDNNQAAQWDDIVYQGTRYSAPLTVKDADDAGASYDQTFSDTGYSPAITMARFNFSSAKAYCQSTGRTLADYSQLYTLRKGYPSVHSSKNWPVELPYITSYEGSPYKIDMTTGKTTAISAQEAYYVTCAEQTTFEVVTSQSRLTGVVDETPVRIVTRLRKNGVALSGYGVFFSGDSSLKATYPSNGAITNSNGYATAEISSPTAKTFTGVMTAYDVDGEDLSKSVTFSFTANEFLANLSLETTKNNAEPDSGETNQVVATLTDNNNNALADYPLSFSVSSHASDIAISTTPSNGKTNSAGQVTANIAWNGELKADTTVSVIGEYNGSTYLSDSSTVTFTAAIPTYSGGSCGEINDTDRTNAVENCLKVVRDKGYLYTSSPSQAFTENGLKAYLRSKGVYKNYSFYSDPMFSGVDGGKFLQGSRPYFVYVCDYLNSIKFLNYTSWETSPSRTTYYTSGGLIPLWASIGESFYTKFGWPIEKGYGLGEFSSGVFEYYYANLYDGGRIKYHTVTLPLYLSCMVKQ